MECALSHRSNQITSPANCACEWAAVRRCTIELHCSDMSTCLVGYDDVIYPHVLQTPR
jgi:hypothetical protein